MLADRSRRAILPVSTTCSVLGCVDWPLPHRLFFGENHERAQQTSPASYVYRVSLDAGGTGDCGRFAAPARSAGLDVVGLLHRRQRRCGSRHRDILRSVRTFDLRRQGHHGRIPRRPSAWLQLASGAAMGRWRRGRRQLPRFQRQLHMYASLDDIDRIELPGARRACSRHWPAVSAFSSTRRAIRWSMAKAAPRGPIATYRYSPNDPSQPQSFTGAMYPGEPANEDAQCVGLERSAPESSALSRRLGRSAWNTTIIVSPRPTFRLRTRSMCTRGTRRHSATVAGSTSGVTPDMQVVKLALNYHWGAGSGSGMGGCSRSSAWQQCRSRLARLQS